MANEWNVSYPLDPTLISDIPGEIRKLKDSVKDQLSHEHETPVDGDATGDEHSSGSAVAYEGSSTPEDRPGGATLGDNAIDRGRLWIDGNKTQIPLMRWNGSAFVTVGMSPSTYEGEESITFPNGLIMKQGLKTLDGDTTTITFDTAFLNACTRVIASPSTSSGDPANNTNVHTFTKTTFKIYLHGGSGQDINWFAIGY